MVSVAAPGSSVAVRWCTQHEPPAEKQGPCMCTVPGCRGYQRRRRGVIRGWSVSSRRRFQRLVARIDWSLMGDRFALVSHTYPRSFRGDPRRWHEDLRRFRVAFERRWGARPRGIWKLEWQRPRRVGEREGEAGPHFHMVLAVPVGVPFEVFGRWCRAAWHELVGGGDGDHARHGTDVRSADVRSAALYLIREMGKTRQTVLPPEWVATGAGRTWGGYDVAVVEHELPLEWSEYVLLRRALRRLCRSRGYRPRQRGVVQGITVYSAGGAWGLFGAVLLMRAGLTGSGVPRDG